MSFRKRAAYLFVAASAVMLAAAGPALSEESGPPIEGGGGGPSGPVSPAGFPAATTGGGASAVRENGYGNPVAPAIVQTFSDFSSSFASAVLYPDRGAASANIVVPDAQTLQAQSHAAGDALSADIFSSAASGQTQYSFAITGPKNIDVPVWIYGSLTATLGVSASNADGSAESGFFVNGYDDVLSGNSRAVEHCSTGVGAQCGALDFATEVSIKAFSKSTNGHFGTVILYVDTSTDATSYSGVTLSRLVGKADAVASVDPYLVIDPTFAAANPGYSIQFSDGVDNGAGPAPEPATWALMMLGVGAMGAALRTRRRRIPETMVTD